jgi:uncharacterized protein YuzE
MRVTYDPATGAAYLYLVDRIGPGEARRQEVVLDGRMVLDFDEGGKLLGIEILEGDVLLRSETVEGAKLPGGGHD